MKFVEEKENKFSNLKFGLNTGFILTKFEVVEEESSYLEMILTKGETKINRRFYLINDSLDEKAHKKEEYQRVRTIITLMKAITNKTENELKQIFINDISEIDFLKLAATLVPNDIANIKFDVFLQYQYNMSDKSDITFLEIPRNVSQGIFLVRHKEGDWSEVRNDNGLHYVNPQGEKHPFGRSKWFLGQNWAIQQKKDKSNNNSNETIDFTNSDNIDINTEDFPFQT